MEFKPNSRGAIKALSILIMLVVLGVSTIEQDWKDQIAKANGTTIKIMPLGDSITVGKYSGSNTSSSAASDDIGYRKDLHDQLEASGYSIDFIGTNSNGSTFPFSDPEHEGHNGWTDSQVATNIYDNGGENWLSQNHPEVVLLHIGTNSLSTNPSDVENILDEIDQFELAASTKVIVIVARIIDWVPLKPAVHVFNNNVEAMVKSRPDYGFDLFMVDMESQAGLIYKDDSQGGDMIDGLHPYATGYTKMADCWKLKIDEIFLQGTSNNLPVFDDLIGSQTNYEGDQDISISLAASDADFDTLEYYAVNLPPGLSINSSTGLITGDITSNASSGSPYYVAVSVADGNPCGSTRHLFYWTIKEVKFPPEIHSPLPDRTDNEGDYIEIQIIASDPGDIDLTYSAQNLPTGLSINPNSGLISGTISFAASEQAYFPDFPIEIKVEDDSVPPQKAVKDFTWTVHDETGSAPVVNNPGNQRNLPGDEIVLQIHASDPDGDVISFTGEQLPPNITLHPGNGMILGEIAAHAFLDGPYNVEITVADEFDNRAKVNFNWFISESEIFLPLILE